MACKILQGDDKLLSVGFHYTDPMLMMQDDQYDDDHVSWYDFMFSALGVLYVSAVHLVSVNPHMIPC